MTKIICTIGPNTSDNKSLIKLKKAGMDVVRLNGSHSDLKWHKKTISTIRKVLNDTPIIFDLPGQKIRVGNLQKEKTIFKGQLITFTKNKKDLGNIDWSSFKNKFLETIHLSMPFLKDRGHYVVFIKDLQPKEGNINLLHSEIIEGMNKIKNLNYIGMKIWADESINLYPYGYPHSFVSNQLHQYIMIFRKKL